MKIAFIGTHGTGKTTLTHELVCELRKTGKDANFLGEIARSCPFPLNENTTKKSQVWLILSQIINELEEENKAEILVCDRSAFDPYVYYVNKFGENKILESLVKEHMKTYSFLIKVPIRKGLLKEDKLRSTNPEFQKDIDELMSNMLKKLSIKHTDGTSWMNNTDKTAIQKIIKKIEL